MRPKVSFGFCAMVCFLGWLDSRMCLWFLLCSAIHEVGHLLAMKILGVPVFGIQLGAAGAVIRAAFPDYRSEILCTLAGPVVGAVPALFLLRTVPQAALIAFGLSAVNLLPVYPLDGGRILNACLLLWRPQQAEKICRAVRGVVFCLLMLLACWGAVSAQMGLWPIFAALALLWRGSGRE